MTKKMEYIKLNMKGSKPPLVWEEQELTSISGVELFLHIYGGIQTSAPIRTSRFTIKPGSETKEDRHAVCELWLVSQGELDVTYDGEHFHVTSGQAVFFESYKPHATKNIGKNLAEVFSVWWSQL